MIGNKEDDTFLGKGAEIDLFQMISDITGECDIFDIFIDALECFCILNATAEYNGVYIRRLDLV